MAVFSTYLIKIGGITMSYKVGLIVDMPSEDVNNDEVRHTDEQKEETGDVIGQILSTGYETEKIIANEKIMERLGRKDIDIVFNLSTGIRGESRQSQIPAVLEMMGIPYVGSGVLAHSLALNKAVAKQIFRYHHIATPCFQIYQNGEEEIDKSLCFPIIVKPACEGSGFGIHKDSVVYNEEALLKKVKELLKLYQPPVLAEEFIEGREFTIGIIGNGKDRRVLPILEIDFEDVPEAYGKFYTFEVKTDFGHKTKYHCPAPLSVELKKEITENALGAFDALGCRDMARVDVRVKDGKAYIIEINSLPGLKPVYSDLPKMAEAAGLSYEELIMNIFVDAVKRVENNKKTLF
jgi:D-alanine-D-alanine ligase